MLRTQFETKRNGVFDPDAALSMLNPHQQQGVKAVEKGFTKSRIKINPEHQQGITLGLISIWNSQMEIQEHAAAFSGVIRDMRSVLFTKGSNGAPTIYQMLRAVRGMPAAKMLQQYVNIAATSDTVNAYNALDGISKILAHNMSIAYLCGNLGTAAKQFPSFFRVLPYAGAASTLNAVYDYIQQPIKFEQECYRLDPQLV